MSFSYERRFRAWANFLGVALAVGPPPAGTAAEAAGGGGWEGVVEGQIEIEVVAEREGGAATTSVVVVPVRVRVVRPPPRRRRLLFDLFHSSAYPNGFFPTDDLMRHPDELMDLHGDHPHTNYRSLAAELRAAGFFVELLRGSFLDFDAAQYGALILADPEERWVPGEAAKLAADVRRRGLGLVVAADWHDPAVMAALYYKVILDPEPEPEPDPGPEPQPWLRP